MIRVPNPVKISVHQDQLNIEIMMVSSPIKLGSGGSARLASVNKNHHAAIRGKIICNPRAKYKIRLCVRS